MMLVSHNLPPRRDVFHDNDERVWAGVHWRARLGPRAYVRPMWGHQRPESDVPA